MRSKNLAAVVATAVVLTACSSIVAAPVAASEHEEPVGNLAELMRAILFPNSNFLFDVQMTDPGSPPDPAEEGDGTVSSLFSGIYTGWQVPQQAALALAEIEPLIMNPDRMCQNGTPAPVGNEDYQKYAKQLTEVAKKIYAAAHEEDRDTVSDLTNDLAGACEDCHAIYRRYPESSRCK
ncbi:MAG: cytochrome c [Acidobacteriota bacterium]|nr:cytochrome c [Acidobacteriota bacterium]